MQPDEECVIHIMKPAEGLVGYTLRAISLKYSMKKLVMTGQ
jgi:hypothetical protein